MPKNEARFRALSRHIATDKSWADELRNPTTPDMIPSRSKILTFLKTHFPDKSPENSLTEYKSWVVLSTAQIASAARDAVRASTSLQQARARRKRELAKLLLLNTHNECVQFAIQQLRALIPIYTVKRKVVPYPPLRHWVVESQAIWDLWSYKICKARQPDTRINRKAMHMLDPAKLDHDLTGDKSAIYEDEDGKLVAMAISQFCKEEKVLHWVNEIVLLNVALARNIRVRMPRYHCPTF